MRVNCFAVVSEASWVLTALTLHLLHLQVQFPRSKPFAASLFLPIAPEMLIS